MIKYEEHNMNSRQIISDNLTVDLSKMNSFIEVIHSSLSAFEVAAR